MAILSNDGTYVTVVRGDTLWAIARDYGKGATYQQLAAINNISNPDLIYVNQKIYLTKTSSSTQTNNTSATKATITHFGLQSNSNGTLFALWSWSKANTASFKVSWTYSTGDGVWFVGSDSTITLDDDNPSASKQSTYSIPSNAVSVKFKVKPISKTYTKNEKTTSYWTAEWSTEKTYDVGDKPPLEPSTPSVTLEKFTLTARLDNLDVNATSIQFQVVKNDSTVYKTGTANIVTDSASYSCIVDAGNEYKVRCRSCRDKLYSDWSNYSSNYSTIPSAPTGITTIRASSETSVYLEWPAVKTAETYDLEYTTKKEYFDGSDQTTTQSNIETTHFEKTGLETGTEYFFRVRAVNDDGYSAWSGIKSVVIGKDPAAPTTWSSTTTVITGEPLTLYWVHNAEDGSSQTYAELELYINGVKETHTIQNSTNEDEKDKTSSYSINTSPYVEGSKIQWRVRTAGITKAYGDWSVQRTVDIYAPPTLELNITDKAGSNLDTITVFPFYISALAGPNTQMPVSYHLAIASNEIYETVDNIGNAKTVNIGEEVYSKHFDISDPLLVEFSANNINLENNIRYTATCTVSMDSGLTDEASLDFVVSWIDMKYQPNAEIGIDDETLVAHIRPYCEEGELIYYKVDYASNTYTATSETIDFVYGEPVSGAITTSGEQVFFGTTADGDEVYYCEIEEKTIVEGVVLSVYRREFDGSFTELATDLVNTSNTFVTDPHPALDYARYRVVAITEATGAVSYYDVPGYPVGGKAVIIQWDEEWSNFNASSEDALEQPPWSGSLLKLPYNIDVSDSNKVDVSLIEYIGREHPITYYGTQLGQTSTWNMVIEKSDKDTLYALRRLSRWMGDVYVREPSGSGYWAKISVSFSQKHMDVTIPVTLDITRVEGGV